MGKLKDNSLSLSAFTAKLKTIWPNLSVISFVGVSKDVYYNCPIHGQFHKRGNRLLIEGCTQCRKKPFPLKRDAAWWIKKCQDVHGKRYDYSRLPSYPGKSNKVEIVCPSHGVFLQNLTNHVHNRQGCPKCFHVGHLSLEVQQKMADPEWLRRQVTNKSVTMVASELGTYHETLQRRLDEFAIVAMDTFKGGLEESVYEFLMELGFPERNVRGVLPNNLELDFWFPTERIAVECHGLRWHSYDSIETTIERRRHWQKWRLASDLDIRLFQIYESEWRRGNTREVWQSILRNCFGRARNKIGARQCTVREIPIPDAHEFLIANHLQGTSSNIIWANGLFYNAALVAVMAFGVPNSRAHDLVLCRAAIRKDTSIAGGMSRLWRHSLAWIDKRSVVTYSDNRWASGNIYQLLGFEKAREAMPEYQYLKGQRLLDKRDFQHKKLALKLPQYDPLLTEAQNMFNNGYRRIWNAGRSVWVFHG